MYRFKNRLKHHAWVLNFGDPAPIQLLKASSVGAVTTEAGSAFQIRIVEGKNELLWATMEQGGSRNRLSWPLVDVPVRMRYISADMSTRLLTIRYIIVVLLCSRLDLRSSQARFFNMDMTLLARR